MRGAPPRLLHLELRALLGLQRTKVLSMPVFPSNKLFSVPLQLEKRLLPVQDPLAYHLWIVSQAVCTNA